MKTNIAKPAPKCVEILLVYTKFHLQLTLLHPLEQHITIRIRIHGDLVQRIQLTRAVKHILIHLSVLTSQTAVQHPIVEAPRIHETNGVWANLLEQLHNRVRSRQLNLVLTARATCVELTAFLLKRVQRKEAEQVHEDICNILAHSPLLLNLLERAQIVLDNHPLRMSFAEAVEIDKEVVPRLLLLVAVLGGFKGEERDAPCESGDEVFVGANDVEGAADIAALLEVGEDESGVVCGLFVVEDGACGFEELWQR
jgi:hypothetical protein